MPDKAGQVVAVERPAATKVANEALSAEVLPEGIVLVRAFAKEIVT